MKAQKFVPLLLLIAGLLAYHNSFRAPFLFDDWTHIVENQRIHRLWPPWEIIARTSRPVVHLSLAINYALGRLDPWGYHLFNLAVHILAALTLYGVVRRTLVLEPWRLEWGKSACWLAAAVALVWLVHPLQTESVTYVIQRAESLMGLFYLLTLYCLIRSCDSLRPMWWRVAGVVSCAVGMGSKQIMVTAPVVALLCDRVFLARSWREVKRQRWTLHACLAATWLLLPWLLANAPSEWRESAGFGYHGITPVRYLLTQSGVVLHYLRLAFWPHPLCFDYGWPTSKTAGEVLPALIVVCGLLAATAWAWVRKPPIGFLGVWFFLILAPTSSFIPIVDVAFEHRMYLPLAAVVSLVVLGVFMLGKRLPGGQRRRQVIGWGLGGAAVLSLTAVTVQRNLDYRSELAIWQDTIDKRPNNPRAHVWLGIADFRVGKVRDAIGQYEEALRIEPSDIEAHFGLANALLRQGKVSEAATEYSVVVSLQPNLAEAHFNLGNALLRQGKVREAVEQYRQTLRIKPDDAGAHKNLGYALLQQDKPEEAAAHLRQWLRIKPDDAEARSKLGYALEQAGKVRDAIGQYEEALRLKPNLTEAENNLAWQLATLPPAQGGDPVRAVGLAQRACGLTGNREAGYLDTLAVAYAAAGQFNEAIATAQQAIALARSAGQTQLVSQVQGRLDLFLEGRAYR